MPERRTLTVYQYDGSFDGLLCCVFESFLRRECPADIVPEGEGQLLLGNFRPIAADPARARRVWAAIPKKISPLAAEWVRLLFLSCAEKKERLTLDFLRKGFRAGAAVTRMLQDETVSSLYKAVQFVENEAHLLKGFLRFSERGGVLTAVITPKNQVLPILGPFFAGRLPQETFLIHDRTHGMALFCRKGTLRIFPAGEIDWAAETEEERAFQALWKQFYRTISIAERQNLPCRQTHCPKRYWENMTELCTKPLPETLQNTLKSGRNSAIIESEILADFAGKDHFS